ncbi:MAG: hypothetical protein ACXWCZ_05335 [Flavisolibacter sp.]
MRATTSSSGIAPLNALFEYSIVAFPDQLVQQQIRDEKRFFRDRFCSFQPVEMDGFVMIAQYYSKEIMEETLIRWLQNITRLQNSFIVTLNNFSSIPPDTIYLRVQEAENFVKLCGSIKMIDGFIRANDCPPVQLMIRPLIIIASGLPENIYKNAINEYAERSFTASFKLEKLSLLKRETNHDSFQLFYSFNLSTPLNQN